MHTFQYYGFYREKGHFFFLKYLGIYAGFFVFVFFVIIVIPKYILSSTKEDLLVKIGYAIKKSH